jgi:hypothetical protein
MMSQSVLESTPTVVSREPTKVAGNERSTESKPKMSPWKWAAITGLLLSISGAIRFTRDLQFSGIARQSTKCPFPLSDLSLVLGTWSAVPNSETHLDPEITRLAGSSDHVIRSYMNSTTGEVASVLVLYGLANSVFGHTPDVCYKAGGYNIVTQPVDREFTTADAAPPARFRGFYVSRQGVSSTEYSEVVWSFWHAGSWWPDVGSRWKLFRYAPAMFKIQIQRQASGISTEEFSCEPLLKEVVRDLNMRIARSMPQNGPGLKKELTSR